MSLAAAAGLSILQRQLLSLRGDDMVLDDWGHRFVADVFWRKPEALTDRQRQMVQVLCWRNRERLPPELVPASEPTLPGGPRPPARKPRR